MKYSKYYNTIDPDTEVEIPEAVIKSRWDTDKLGTTHCKVHDTYFDLQGNEDVPPTPCWRCFDESNPVKKETK